MPVIGTTLLSWIRRRLAAEDGFTMLIAVGVLFVTTLITTAIFVATRGDTNLNKHTLDAQRAYDAATAGANAYLYQLNQNPNYWSTCANDVQATASVPGSTTGEQYSFTYVPANGYTTCTGSPPTASMIDQATGSLRMEFTGYSGNPTVTRTITASFRRASPLDFLWYTVYEALDKSISGYSGCGVFLRNGRSGNCNINWVSGDVINGPMYTQDQYLIYSSNTPTFGRNSNDKIESAAPGTNPANICANNLNGSIVENSCGNAVINGTAVPNAPTISPPSNNTQLFTDATTYGKTYTGTTTITLNGTTATVVNCPSSCTTTNVDLTQYPVLYVNNGTNCTPIRILAIRGQLRNQRLRRGRVRLGQLHDATDDRSRQQHHHQRQPDHELKRTEHSDGQRGTGPDRQRVHSRDARGHLPGRVLRQQQLEHLQPDVFEPDDRRRHAGDPALIHRRQLRLWGIPGQSDRERRDCAVFPGGRGDDGRHRIPQELHLRRQAPRPLAAIPVRHLHGRLAALPRNALHAKGQLLNGGIGRRPPQASSTPPEAGHPISYHRLVSAVVVIMAAGKGTRMRSVAPKLLHTLCGRPMIAWSVAAAREAGVGKVVVVQNAEGELEATLGNEVSYARQEQARGTADAVRAAAAHIDDADTVVVLNGDHPLITAATVHELVRAREHSGAAAVIGTAVLDDPSGYGRVVRGPNGTVERVVETKGAGDATELELHIREVNAGLYAFDGRELLLALERVGSDNVQGELYLPDVVPILRDHERTVIPHELSDLDATFGVNDRAALAEARARLQERIHERHMLAGVTIVDPGCTVIDVGVEIEAEAVIAPFTSLHGATRIGSGSTIGPLSTLIDTRVGAGATVVHSYSKDAEIGDRVSVGPFAYLRPGTVLREGAKAGTFVEIKNSDIGAGTKVPHLSYIGDADIGEETNLGAATITANFDGSRKHRTTIGSRVKTSVDTTLVAPVTVGDDAYTAAGSVIGQDVPPGALAGSPGVARGEQRNVEGYSERRKERDQEADKNESEDYRRQADVNSTKR